MCKKKASDFIFHSSASRLLALGAGADDVGVAGVGDGQGGHAVELAAGGAKVHVVWREGGREIRVQE